MADNAIALGRGQAAGSEEVVEYISTLGADFHQAFSPRQVEHEEIYSEYYEVQAAFIKRANQCLDKLKQPQIEMTATQDWDGVHASMERACAALEKVSAKEKQPAGLSGKLRKSFRFLCKHARVGKFVAQLIPNDSFGSVLCGGLNVIFTAMEQTGFQREAVYKALELLPRILESHVPYTELACDRPDIHRRTAKLYIEICRTLDQILRWFMADTFFAGAKRFLNSSAFSKDLSEQMAEVKLAAKELELRGTQITMQQVKEIQMASKWLVSDSIKRGHQLDGMERGIMKTAERSATFIQEERDKTGNQLEDIDRTVKWLASRAAAYDMIESAVCGNLQGFLQLNMSRLIEQNARVQNSIPQITPTKVLEEFEYNPSLLKKDMESLLSLGIPPARFQLDTNRIHAIQRNPRIRAWLAVAETSIMLLDGGSNIGNASTSFVSAKMVDSLLGQASRDEDSLQVITLAYFCGQHRDYRRDAAASPLALATSILCQLIDLYSGFNPADLQECLEDTDVDGICASFQRLVKTLPANAVVYLVLDGLSCFTIPSERTEPAREVIGYLVDLAREEMAATLKFLFVSPGRCRFLEDLFDEDEILNIPGAPPPSGGPI
ncbi:hypothetical protein GQ53DRAFT_861016 [Thozetella sp. PMI_491]|nr:hypothetical protein GQ53DRAFT_861016 [Thozetella sp. PMI_491]